ncbi:hypothetical protein HC752_03665 [Vibrio sp. S9_S30]|uniref:hypothetical protein n=1 Tax=Vibrio sp. S9_S30 TaxID=2720226 RepID=UPI00168000A0|nr:hypothetical protein [Vibrio sp. S9_S30]MBD1556023.1 hypothetical protein [Vibrio sp. S9_S30]
MESVGFLDGKGLSVLRRPFEIKSADGVMFVSRAVFYTDSDGEEIELVESM